MFDIGFWELVTIAVIGIVVVGPEKLPEVIRTVLGFIRNIKRMYSDAKYEISKELKLDEIKNITRSGSDDFTNAFDSIKADGKKILEEIDKEINDIAVDGKDLLKQIDKLDEQVKKD